MSNNDYESLISFSDIKIFSLDQSRKPLVYLCSTNNFESVKNDKKKIKKIIKLNLIPINNQTQNYLGFSLDSKIGRYKLQPNYCFTICQKNQIIISCGYWDNTILVHSIESNDLLQTVQVFRDTVTSVVSKNNYLVAGSADSTIRIWKINKKKKMKINLKSEQVLFGNKEEILCLDFDPNFDIIVSASLDGSINIYSFIKKKLIRRIKNKYPITFLKICKNGNIITYSKLEQCLTIRSVNGPILKSITDVVFDIIKLGNMGKVLFTSKDNNLDVWCLPSLNHIKQFKFNSTITTFLSLAFDNFLIIGLVNGQILTSNLSITLK